MIIDENILNQLDFDGLIHLLTIDKSQKLRNMVVLHLQTIIKNTNDFKDSFMDYMLQLFILRELTILKQLKKYNFINHLSDYIDIENTFQLMDYLSLLDEKASKNYIEVYINNNDIDGLDNINILLDAAILVNNKVIIDYIKSWYLRRALDTHNQLNLLSKKLNL